MDTIIDTPTLHKLAVQSAAIRSTCSCKNRDLTAWENWPVGYREDDFALFGTLATCYPEDSTLDEYHPSGTSYWAASAPIAPQFYPYNQSTVWQCRSCQRLYLRHNDDGAYHVAPRVRALQAQLIVDAAHVHQGRERATGNS